VVAGLPHYHNSRHATSYGYTYLIEVQVTAAPVGEEPSDVCFQSAAYMFLDRQSEPV